jgi:putative transposase
MIQIRRTSSNVKRWHSGDMCLRWTAAGMLEAEQQFRKVIGYTDRANLVLASNATSPPSELNRFPDHQEGRSLTTA